MKYYQKFAVLPCFSFQDAVKIIGNKAAAMYELETMLKEGSIHRIRKNLYTCVNFATGDDYASRYQIASGIREDAFLSFHSAFEFYGFYNQMYFEVQVCSSKRFAEFIYGGYSYKGYLSKSRKQVKVIQGVRVVSVERAIVDSVSMLGKVMDGEELVKCLDLVHHVSEEKILEMLAVYDKEILYRKVGYVLSFYKDVFSISDSFFEECKKKGIVSNKGFLIGNEKNVLVYNAEWGLYAYKDLRKLAYKGGEEDV